MNDLVIADGLVVDGTGRPPRRADVGIRDGRVTEIGEPGSVRARARLDAEGGVLAPGFVDVHTHYDAQLTWDPAATPSSLHGVTSIVGGNCGFSLAPLSAESAAYLVPMLATVEGMPEQALREGLAVRWESFAGYLDALDDTLVVNPGLLVGHSAVGRLVMGEAAVGETASPDQVESMVALVHDSIEAGALGFSTSRGQAHLDHHGDPVPSRHAAIAETLALCRAAGQHPGTSVETIPTIDQVFDDDAQMLLVAMSLAAGRPVNWNSLGLEQDATARASRLAPSDAARAAGGRVVALPPASRSSCGTRWSCLSCGSRSRTGPPPCGCPSPSGSGRSPTPPSASTSGRAPRRSPASGSAGRSSRSTTWRIPRCARSLGVRWPSWRPSAAAARATCSATSPSRAGCASGGGHRSSATTTRAGATWSSCCEIPASSPARRTPAPTSTSSPRSRCTPASSAAPLGSAACSRWRRRSIGHGPVEIRADLPAGARRLFCEPLGISAVLANGVRTVADGRLTGASAGRTIRPGRDTATPMP